MDILLAEDSSYLDTFLHNTLTITPFPGNFNPIYNHSGNNIHTSALNIILPEG